MWPFSKKKKQQLADAQNSDQPQADIQTMPDVFYGGKNPVVYEQQSQPLEQKKTVQQSQKKVSPPAGRGKRHSEHKKALWIGTAIVAFVIVVAGISWYYLAQAGFVGGGQEQPVSPVDQQPPATQESEQEIGSDNSTVDSVDQEDDRAATVTATTTVATTTAATSTANRAAGNAVRLSFPAQRLPVDQDADEDGLTTQEELLFDVDPEVWDTDGDGYYDGQEVLNLYNPSGEAPVKLIDSALVREYRHPRLSFRLYYPRVWEQAAVTSEESQVLLSSVTGAFIEVHTRERNADTSFTDWFAVHAPGEPFSRYTQERNRFDVAYWQREDGLVAFVPTASHVFVIIYNTGESDIVRYPTVMQMIVASFRPGANRAMLDEQPASRPGQSTATSTVSTSTVSTSTVSTSTSTTTGTSTDSASDTSEENVS